MRTYLIAATLLLSLILTGCGGGSGGGEEPPPPTAPTVYLTASPSVVEIPSDPHAPRPIVTLRWTSTNATSLTSSFGATTLSGQQTVVIVAYGSGTLAYTVTASGPGGSATSRATVSYYPAAY